MARSESKFVPGPDEALTRVADNGRVTDNFDPKFYERQVPRGYAWDTTYAFRLATARAKDRARIKLMQAIRAEARRLEWESYSDPMGGRSFNTFVGQAHSNVTRSIDGVEGAPDNAIKL